MKCDYPFNCAAGATPKCDAKATHTIPYGSGHLYRCERHASGFFDAEPIAIAEPARRLPATEDFGGIAKRMREIRISEGFAPVIDDVTSRNMTTPENVGISAPCVECGLSQGLHALTCSRNVYNIVTP